MGAIRNALDAGRWTLGRARLIPETMLGGEEKRGQGEERVEDAEPSVIEAQARIAALHLAYAAALTESVTSIRDQWQRLRIEGWEARCAADLYHRLHRLAGNAGMFGRELLGEVAADLEARLFEWCRRSDAAGAVAVNFEEADRLVSELFTLGMKDCP